MTLPYSAATNSSVICVLLVSFCLPLLNTLQGFSSGKKKLMHCFSTWNNFPISLLDSSRTESRCTRELTQLVFQQSSEVNYWQAIPLRNHHIHTWHLWQVAKLGPRACFLPYWIKAWDFGFFHCFNYWYWETMNRIEYQFPEYLMSPRTADLN